MKRKKPAKGGKGAKVAAAPLVGAAAPMLLAPAVTRIESSPVDGILEAIGGGLLGGGGGAGVAPEAPLAQPLPQPVNQTATAHGGTASAGKQQSRSAGGNIEINAGLGPGFVLVAVAVVALFVLWLMLGGA